MELSSANTVEEREKRFGSLQDPLAEGMVAGLGAIVGVSEADICGLFSDVASPSLRWRSRGGTGAGKVVMSADVTFASPSECTKALALGVVRVMPGVGVATVRRAWKAAGTAKRRGGDSGKPRRPPSSPLKRDVCRRAGACCMLRVVVVAVPNCAVVAAVLTGIAR